MKMQTLILIIVFLIPTVAVFYSCTYIENHYYNHTPIEKTDGSVDENELVDLINDYRESIGLNPLTHEVLASQVCEDRNYLDIEQGVFPSHEGWSNMLIDAMVNPNDGSHLVAYNYISAQELFNAYLASESHRKGLEMEKATHIGTSIVDRRNHTLIVKY